MAQSSGLQLVDPSPTTARQAHTEGIGELIRAAVDENITRIVIGVGGSASTDGGMGALCALGAVFLDEHGFPLRGSGESLRHVAEIDLDALDPRLATVDLVLCSDVANPFAGPDGAAAIFGPQKGADPATIAELDLGLRVFAAALARSAGVNPIDDGWGDSGGGFAGGMRAACGAHAANGVDVVADLVGLDGALASQDVVIVGEGSIDLQSAMGKTPVGVARRARGLGVPAAAVVGRNLLQTDFLLSENIVAICAATDSAPTPADALRDPARWTTAATRVLMARLREPLVSSPARHADVCGLAGYPTRESRNRLEAGRGVGRRLVRRHAPALDPRRRPARRVRGGVLRWPRNAIPPGTGTRTGAAENRGQFRVSRRR
jgi:glycerate kinase